MNTRNNPADIYLLMIAIPVGILALLAWKLKTATGASFDSAMTAIVGSIGAVVLGWFVASFLQTFNWFIFGLMLAVIWPSWWGMINDIAANNPYFFSSGRIVRLGELPFYAGLPFKIAVEAVILVGGYLLTMRSSRY